MIERKIQLIEERKKERKQNTSKKERMKNKKREQASKKEIKSTEIMIVKIQTE